MTPIERGGVLKEKKFYVLCTKYEDGNDGAFVV